MIISHKHRFIFVHVNKCAGTSITRALFPHLGADDVVLGCLPEQEKLHAESKKNGGLEKHSTAGHIKSMLDADIWQNYFKFAFVRNPWDRLVSSYHWVLNSKWDDGHGRMQAVREAADFEEYVLSPYCNRRNCMDYLADDNGEILVDFIGRYENLAADFSEVIGRSGMPAVKLGKHNMTKHKNYTAYYNPLLVDLVEEWFARDIAQFGYRYN